MEAGSDGDGSKKPKRQMKTPFQLETLEKTYRVDRYPTEPTRLQLSEQLGLTDRQLQMWFCHRRLKDKKEEVVKKLPTAGTAGRTESSRDELMVAEHGSDHGSGGSRSRSESRSGSGSRSRSRSGSGPSQFENGDDVPLVKRVYQPLPQRMLRRVIDCVEAQLGEALREDGPILGMEFDELPPGSFGTPIVVREHRERPRHSCEGNLFEQPDAKPIKAAMKGIHELVEPSIRSDAYGRISHYYDSHVDDLIDKRLSSLQGNGHLPRGYAVDEKVPTVSILSQQRESGPEDNDLNQHNEEVMQMGRKRKIDEAITGRDVQSHEKRIRKELEKQDLLRRKREEQMRKEMEKQDRERRKEEERMMREKQRQEERFQREEKREIERREKFLQKESLKAERRRQKEELRKEKEALRLKAAVERASARRIAKEYMELIEDERLELMELAASSKGLPSIVSLDHDTLQNLDSFRDSLCAFPPKSVQVQLKRPFAIQPWIDSDDNIGNLLMVWRFCMTFADVLRLWPFTLDEFVQAFHDYDSRLLAEVHIALLKLIIRDIEDVARTPCGGLGTNQYTAANPEGGHPRIVEGAYMWGFDIRNWLNHINPLTWPEILRQFALSAGFGPQLKKESIERPCLPENDEGKGCEDIVSMLRSGSAAENAATLMQEKGVNLQRKSRHRLTPGTVKFAAYHVLCLEGSKGLTVLELADKIQKSGLRDLSTSKTPDASISVALSRDPILFERIAPSTYCVRPDFRKDPANAEEVISAAREKIQRFLNGILGGDNADDVEKDDDSECDLAEGPEVDDLGTPSTANKDSIDCNEVNYSVNGKHNLCDDAVLDMQNEVDTTGVPASNPNQVGSEIDESICGEPWVQGLTEGEYSDLCVEERLNALVALIGIANEGNSIRAVLEDRLDAATSVRKQMWAEAQLDKKRIREECVTKCHDSSFMTAAEGGQSPVPVTDNKYNEDSLKLSVKEELSAGAETSQNHLNDLPAESNLPMHEVSMGQTTPPIQQNGYSAERSRLQLKAFIGHKAEEMYVYRSLPLGQDRRRNRYWQFVASTSWHDPGTGRILVELHDGCWRLIDTEEAFDTLLMSLDTRGERESHLHVMLQKIEMSFKQNVRRVLGCDIKVDGCVVAGMGSSPAYVTSAESPSSAVCLSNSDTWQPSSSFKIELGRTEIEKKNALKRYQDLEIWMWKECFSLSTLLSMRYGNQECTPLLGICDFCHDSFLFKEAFCPSCHRAFGTFDNKLQYPEHAMQCEDRVEGNKNNVCRSDPAHPLRIRLIKALITLFEVMVQSDALQSSWAENHRVPWGKKLHAGVSTGDLLQILTQFENAIKRDCLSPDFETTEELLSSCALSARTVCNSAYPGSVPELPWIPQTTAAVSLRLLELDASVSYNLDQKAEPHADKEAANIVVEHKFPSRYAYLKNIGKVETTEMNQRIQEESWAGVHSLPGNSTSRKTVRSRGGGGGRARGRSQKRASVSVSAPGKQNSRVNRTLSQVVMHQKHGRGRRTVRRRRIEKVVEGAALNNVSSSPRNYERELWVGEENREMEIEDAYIGRSDGEANNESEDSDHAIRYERGNWGSSYDVASNTNMWNSEQMMDDEDSDVAEEENELEEDDENLERDVEMNDESDGNAVGFRDDDSDSLVSGEYSD